MASLLACYGEVSAYRWSVRSEASSRAGWQNAGGDGEKRLLWAEVFVVVGRHVGGPRDTALTGWHCDAQNEQDVTKTTCDTTAWLPLPNFFPRSEV